MWGRGIIANDRERYSRIELIEEAVEDGVFIRTGLGFVRSGWFFPWIEGFRMFFNGWTGLDWMRRAGLTVLDHTGKSSPIWALYGFFVVN